MSVPVAEDVPTLSEALRELSVSDPPAARSEQQLQDAAASAADGGEHDADSSSSSGSSDSDILTATEGLNGTAGSRGGPRETLPPESPADGDAAVGLLYDETMERHVGPDHFERPARIIALHAELAEQQLLGRCWQLPPRQATDAELLLAHSEAHIRKVDSMFGELFPERPEALAGASYCFADKGMGDVYVCGDTAEAARFAAGCCVQAVLSVLHGPVRRALAVVRPPGHHAECDRAMGFCFFNNVAVAALVALQQPGIKRVAVLDWDVHHGNGIQNILSSRPDALYLSLHRDPRRFYPYTSGYLAEAGEGAGEGFNVNVPWLKKGMADGDYLAAFSLVVEPILEAYQPDLVIVAAGFDAADGDPLGGCKLSPEGYGTLTERLLRFAGGRLVLALEGGYNNRVTAWCAAACLRTLLAGSAQPPLPRDKDHLWPAEGHNSLKLVYEFQRQHWPVLRARSWAEAWEAHLKEVHVMLGANSRSKRGTASASGAASGGSFTAATAGPAAAAAAASTSGGGAGGGGFVALMADAMQEPHAGSPAAEQSHTPPPPSSLQEAFLARKAAKAAAAAAAAASPAAGDGVAEASAAAASSELSSATAFDAGPARARASGAEAGEVESAPAAGPGAGGGEAVKG